MVSVLTMSVDVCYRSTTNTIQQLLVVVAMMSLRRARWVVEITCKVLLARVKYTPRSSKRYA